MSYSVQVSSPQGLILRLRAFHSAVLTAFLLFSLSASNAYSALPHAGETQRNISYVVKGGPSRTLDIYRPQVSKEKKVPVVVYIHGGGWCQGNKEEVNPKQLLKRGLAVVSINYRLAQEAKWPAQIYDCKAAIRWLRAHGSEYGLSTSKIGVWGPSAGGHLAAMLGTTGGIKTFEGSGGNLDKSSTVQAVVDISGISDLSAIVKSSAIGNLTVIELLGSDNKVLERTASPIVYVGKTTPPFMLLHGDLDDVVQCGQSYALAAALQKAGSPVILRIVHGAKHGIGFDTPEFLESMDFLKKQLTGP